MDRLSDSAQENILALLLFNDEQALYLSTIIKASYFESDLYKLIADQALTFIENYQKAPGIHIADMMVEDIEKYPDLNKILHDLQKLSKRVHVDYILNELKNLIRKYNLRSTLTKAVQALQNGDLSEVEEVLEKRNRSDIQVFEAGTNFGDMESILDVLDKHAVNIISTGIGVLDRYKIGLEPGTMFLGVAAAGKGKSWMLTHIGKAALAQGKTVLHITLENSRELTIRRYLQSVMGLSKDTATYMDLPVISKGDNGELEYITQQNIEVEGLKDYTRESLKRKISREFGEKAKNLYVKKYPMSYLTLMELRNYLIGMERYVHFIPDVVLLDYIDLMKLDTSNYRLDVGSFYKAVRGMAEEFGFALGTVTQSNRSSFKSKSVRASDIAEDISKIQVADVAVTYSQTDDEHSQQLARLRVEKARDNISGIEFVITQNYTNGSFCMDSVLVNDAYFDLIK